MPLERKEKHDRSSAKATWADYPAQCATNYFADDQIRFSRE
jgi:hypothetical protein